MAQRNAKHLDAFYRRGFIRIADADASTDADADADVDVVGVQHVYVFCFYPISYRTMRFASSFSVL
jgi:hypothetical protein